MQSVRQRMRHADVVLLIPPGLGLRTDQWSNDPLPGVLAALGLPIVEAERAMAPGRRGLILGFDTSWRPIVRAGHLKRGNDYVEHVTGWLDDRLPAALRTARQVR